MRDGVAVIERERLLVCDEAGFGVKAAVLQAQGAFEEPFVFGVCSTRVASVWPSGRKS